MQGVQLASFEGGSKANLNDNYQRTVAAQSNTIVGQLRKASTRNSLFEIMRISKCQVIGWNGVGIQWRTHTALSGQSELRRHIEVPVITNIATLSNGLDIEVGSFLLPGRAAEMKPVSPAHCRLLSKQDLPIHTAHSSSGLSTGGSPLSEAGFMDVVTTGRFAPNDILIGLKLHEANSTVAFNRLPHAIGDINRGRLKSIQRRALPNCAKFLERGEQISSLYVNSIGSHLRRSKTPAGIGVLLGLSGHIQGLCMPSVRMKYVKNRMEMQGQTLSVI